MPSRILCASLFQSTPPRGRRPHQDGSPSLSVTVSIHASAREATFAPSSCGGASPVSIHASAREATRRRPRRTRPDRCFNPRLRAGGDRLALLSCIMIRCFNPRLRAGGDSGSHSLALVTAAFQSTPPRGRRLPQGQSRRSQLPFQSTPPRGRRLLGWGDRLIPDKFQSTPPRGRRLNIYRGIVRRISVSIHASAREATRARHAGVDFVEFQSTPPRGRRP